MEKGPRIVYATDRGRICARCGWPQQDCHCASSLPAADELIPAKIAVRLRIEKRTGGKSITVVDGLPKNRAFVESLTRELKKSCGTGGSSDTAAIELQGDQRERLRELLTKKGWTVKG